MPKLTTSNRQCMKSSSWILKCNVYGHKFVTSHHFEVQTRASSESSWSFSFPRHGRRCLQVLVLTAEAATCAIWCVCLLAVCIGRPSADGGFWTQIAAALEGAEGEEIVLLGDLNVNFLQPSAALFSHLKQAVLLSLQLSNLITQPTRFSKSV